MRSRETEIVGQNADKREMRSYLLGRFDRGTQWEERILSAPEIYDELLIVEEELIDQYVAGGLSKRERQQFETNFLITAERQKNLRFGQLLKRYSNTPLGLDRATRSSGDVNNRSDG